MMPKYGRSKGQSSSLSKLKTFVAKEEKYKETFLKKIQKDYLEEKKKEMEEKKNKYQKKDKKPKSEGADGKEEVMTLINPEHKFSYK